MPTDTYPSTISTESREVLAHFVPEAPEKLNTYACSLEEALLESLREQQSQAKLIADYGAYVKEILALLTALQEQNDAAQRILTDPEQLLEYVKGFFGPEGACPGGAMITRTPNAITNHG